MRRLSALALALTLIAACVQQPLAPKLESEANFQPSSTGSSLVINEVDYDQPSTDTAEFIELANNGDSEVELLGFVVNLINGSNDTVYATIELPDVALAVGGYFVICGNAATVADCDLDVTPDSNLIQNGSPDAVTLSRADTVVDALSYEGDVPGASEGTGAGLVDAGDGAMGLSRVPDGNDTNQNDVDFALCPITPGTENVCGDDDGEDDGDDPVDTVGDCGSEATLISAIQGSGDSSPLRGGTLVIEGIVVGDFQDGDGDPFDTDLDGFYVQEELGDWDSDDTTSEGVFVFAPGAADVKVGDRVRVAGRVTEFNGLTEITDVSSVDVCGTDTPIVSEVLLPLGEQGDLERFEGMLVRFPQELVISEYFNFDRFGELVLTLPPTGLERTFQPTSYVEPGAEAAALSEEIALGRITLDDARSSQNPHPARHPNGSEFTLDNLFRGGDTIAGAEGVLDYRFGLYRVQPTTGAEYGPVNPRPPMPDVVGGSLRVASFNVLNYFTTLDDRGADTAAEFQRQRAKIIAALAAIDADVVGLVEIENNSDAIEDLVEGLNSVMGAGTYSSIDTGMIGGDAIKVAFIFKPATVTPLGDYAVLEGEFLDPNGTGFPKNRPALAQTFLQQGNGAAFTAVVNHFKSKGSGCGAGDDDPQQGSCNLTRTLSAGLLLDWLATDPTASGDPDFLLLGDYNAYDEEDPIDALRAGVDGVSGTDDDLTDLLEEFEGEFTYSYLFDGQYGHLDYAFAAPSLLPQVTGTTAWKINADEPDLLDYDMSFKSAEQQSSLFEADPYRSSDHDPIIVGLDLNSPPACGAASASVGQLWPATHRFVANGVSGVGDPEGDPVSVSVEGIYQDEPVLGNNDGNTTPDGEVGTDGSFQVRAERDGTADGRFYHVAFTARDPYGSCRGEVLVHVPVSVGDGVAPVDGGALYDSTSP